MARFDVYQHAKRAPLILDLQADILADLKTRAVVPLLPLAHAKSEKIPRLMPVLRIQGNNYMMMTPDIASIKVSDLGKFIENVEGQRHTIIDAVDFLLQGF